MARTDRTTSDALAELLDSLEQAPYSFGFFEVMRRMECLYADRPRLGRSKLPSDDPIRLAQEPAVDFAPATLTRFEPGMEGKPHRLEVRFMGLLGPNGPLPLHLTEYARDRIIHKGDKTFSRFLDIFHHRMLSFFYRAWADNEPTISFDRPNDDRFSDYVGSLAGLGMASFRGRDEMPDQAKLYYIGRLAAQTKCAEGLEAILTDYFRLPARIESFIGEWMDLPKENICRLGLDPKSDKLNDGVILGTRVWGCQHKFRIIMGPMSYEAYLSLLPNRKRINCLRDIVRNYIGDELAWDIRLILKKKEVPTTHLNKGHRLGWTTWLDNQSLKTDADHLLLMPLSYIDLPLEFWENAQ